MNGVSVDHSTIIFGVSKSLTHDNGQIQNIFMQGCKTFYLIVSK